MAETKQELEARVADLEAENDRLRGQLAAAAGTVGAVAPAAPQRPWLSEGERQELEMYGETNSPFTGERLTTESVREELAGSDRQAGVEIADAPQRPAGTRQPAREREPIEGVDYVWPSVAPGKLAPGILPGGSVAPAVPAAAPAEQTGE